MNATGPKTRHSGGICSEVTKGGGGGESIVLEFSKCAKKDEIILFCTLAKNCFNTFEEC